MLRQFLCITVLVLTLLTGCRSKGTEPVPLPELPPLTVPTIPAEYFGEKVVVPPELQEKYDALIAGTSGIDWDNVDVRTLELDWRRARIYQRYSDPRARGYSFRLVLFAEPRSLADAVANQIAATLGLDKTGFYWAARQRAIYTFSGSGVFNLSEVAQVAWLADWLLQHYPDQIESVQPLLFIHHGTGFGNDI